MLAPLTETALYLSPAQWDAIIASEGSHGYTDVLTQTPLAEIQHPVVLRGDGLTGAIFDVDSLLAHFRFHHHHNQHQPAVQHPILRDLTITVHDILPVIGERVAPDNAAYVAAAIAKLPLPARANNNSDAWVGVLKAFAAFVVGGMPREMPLTRAQLEAMVAAFIMGDTPHASAIAADVVDHIANISRMMNRLRATNDPFRDTLFPFRWVPVEAWETPTPGCGGTYVLNP
jgi:hypothetical protein